jgi:hypothetical protein
MYDALVVHFGLQFLVYQPIFPDAEGTGDVEFLFTADWGKSIPTYILLY